MNTVKHFSYTWRSEDDENRERGRMAIVIDGDRIAMKHLAGNAPRPYHLALAVKEWPELQGMANDAAKTRRNQYHVSVRGGMSGCYDYVLRECRDPMFADFPVRARLHVSMYGKLNAGMSMWLGDFGAILGELLAYEYAHDNGRYELEEVPHDNGMIQWVSMPTIISDSEVVGYLTAMAAEPQPVLEYVLGAEIMAKLVALDEEDFEPYQYTEDELENLKLLASEVAATCGGPIDA